MAAVMSVLELAERSGVNFSTIYKLERGQHQPTAETARKLAQALGIDPKLLYTKEAA